MDKDRPKARIEDDLYKLADKIGKIESRTITNSVNHYLRLALEARAKELGIEVEDA